MSSHVIEPIVLVGAESPPDVTPAERSRMILDVRTSGPGREVPVLVDPTQLNAARWRIDDACRCDDPIRRLALLRLAAGHLDAVIAKEQAAQRARDSRARARNVSAPSSTGNVVVRY